MNVLFIHQNFPGQYGHIARHLARNPAHRVYAISQGRDVALKGVQHYTYPPEAQLPGGSHPYNIHYESAVRTGIAVLRVCRRLRTEGVVPDVVVGHSGWGETLLVKEVFPDTPVLSYFEFFYHARGADVGFDPEFSPPREEDGVRLRLRNAINWMSFYGCDWGHTATRWQRRLYPATMQARITTLHEGIDTQRIAPDPQATLELEEPGLRLMRADEIVTYVARSLEPYRGFHWFMRALPELLRRRPRVQVVVVGGDGISYGEHAPYGGNYRKMMLAELGSRLDSSRVHFLGQLPNPRYLEVLRASSVHVYFTYPFVLSWSMLEAMAAGCVVLGSANPPVDEVLRDGVNGLMVDPRDATAVCDRIEEVLDHPDRMQAIRDAARDTIVQEYDLRGRMLPRWTQLIGALAQRRPIPIEDPEPLPRARG